MADDAGKTMILIKNQAIKRYDQNTKGAQNIFVFY